MLRHKYFAITAEWEPTDFDNVVARLSVATQVVRHGQRCEDFVPRLVVTPIVDDARPDKEGFRPLYVADFLDAFSVRSGFERIIKKDVKEPTREAKQGLIFFSPEQYHVVRAVQDREVNGGIGEWLAFDQVPYDARTKIVRVYDRNIVANRARAAGKDGRHFVYGWPTYFCVTLSREP